MNNALKLTADQALRSAIAYADIKNDELVCTSGSFADGLYHFLVTTLYMRYEFYVDAASGEVPGFSTEPLSCLETLGLCTEGNEKSCFDRCCSCPGRRCLRICVRGQ